MEYQTTDLKKNLKVELDGRAYIIIKSDFTNPGKGSAFVKVKFKSLEDGRVSERTYKSGVSTGLLDPQIEQKEVEYMYKDKDGFNFMDQKSYETIHLPTDQVGESAKYLQEGIRLYLLYHKMRPISIELPNFVELEVVETDPGLKGDSATGGMKKAILQTGTQISVPLFIKVGEVVKVDTRSGEYIERA